MKYNIWNILDYVVWISFMIGVLSGGYLWFLGIKEGSREYFEYAFVLGVVGLVNTLSYIIIRFNKDKTIR